MSVHGHPGDDGRPRPGVRALIEEGTLPAGPPTRIVGRPGRGERCPACAGIIADGECAFELPTAAGPVLLDRGCLNLWMAAIAPGG